MVTFSTSLYVQIMVFTFTFGRQQLYNQCDGLGELERSSINEK
jgi:hypothetical protein